MISFESPDQLIVQTPRYRALTHLLVEMAQNGVDFTEIAGNDDIMFTAISKQNTVPGAFYSTARQGYGDYRHLILVKVRDLAQILRDTDLDVEHIHDY